MPFTLKRRQFAIKLAFVITSNKSQGDIFHKVGICLLNPVSGHNLFYVAISTVSTKYSIKVKILNSENQDAHFKGFNRAFTVNLVYKEIL